MAIRERVSLFNRYRDQRVRQVEPFKTYYIIMEGTNTEPQYFQHLDRYLVKLRARNNIKLVFLDRTHADRGRNTPRQLFSFLRDYKKTNKEDNAVYCMVFDRDSYKGFENPAAAYLDFIRKIKTTAVKTIVTSPCFEIWLLLHREKVLFEHVWPDSGNIFTNRRLNSRFTYLSKMVYDLFGFNPKSYVPYEIVEKVSVALSQAPYLTSDLEKMAFEIGENVSDFIKELCLDPRNLK